MQDTQFRRLIYLSTLAVAATLLSLLLISTGFFDPHPIGQKIGQEPFFQLNLAPSMDRLQWLERETPHPPYSIRLMGALSHGEDDIAYGLALMNGDDQVIIVLSPLGYAAIWKGAEQQDHLLNWQRWPHINPGRQENEIWVNVEEKKLQVRINRELLWEGDINPPTAKIGVFGQSFGNEAVIDYKSIEFYGQ